MDDGRTVTRAFGHDFLYFVLAERTAVKIGEHKLRQKHQITRYEFRHNAAGEREREKKKKKSCQER